MGAGTDDLLSDGISHLCFSLFAHFLHEMHLTQSELDVAGMQMRKSDLSVVIMAFWR